MSSDLRVTIGRDAPVRESESSGPFCDCGETGAPMITSKSDQARKSLAADFRRWSPMIATLTLSSLKGKTYVAGIGVRRSTDC